MKESILAALTMAAKHDAHKGNNLNQRVVGTKADVVTQGDIEIGDLITKILLTTKDRITVQSEEHEEKQTNLIGNEKERYYVAIDDIDGTNNLRVGMGFLPYCSMIVAFDAENKPEGQNYRYSDYSHAACIDYTKGKIFYTEKGLGRVEVYDLDWNKVADSTENKQDNTKLSLTLSTDLVSTQRGGLVGYAETSGMKVSPYPKRLDATYTMFAAVDSGCSVFEYAMVGMGIRNGYVSSGKKEHELPLLYAFCKETGKEMVDFDGVPYGDKEYDFKGGDANVIAADPKVIELIRLSIQAQDKAKESMQELVKNTAVKGPASARMMRERRAAEERAKQDGGEVK